MYRSEPDYVSGRKGHFEIVPWITHPPFCVCDVCPPHRERAAKKNGRPIEEEWASAIVIRARRVSPSPKSRVESAAAARIFKRDEEKRLVEAVSEAAAAKREAAEKGIPTGAAAAVGGGGGGATAEAPTGPAEQAVGPGRLGRRTA